MTGRTLRELEGEFLVIESENTMRTIDTIAGADGVMFLCPKCFDANNGSVGTHRVICWQPHVPQTRSPRPGRWALMGTSIDDLSLVAGSSSVLLTSGCQAHFFVQNGRIK